MLSMNRSAKPKSALRVDKLWSSVTWSMNSRTLSVRSNRFSKSNVWPWPRRKKRGNRSHHKLNVIVKGKEQELTFSFNIVFLSSSSVKRISTSSIRFLNQRRIRRTPLKWSRSNLSSNWVLLRKRPNDKLCVCCCFVVMRVSLGKEPE